MVYKLQLTIRLDSDDKEIKLEVEEALPINDPTFQDRSAHFFCPSCSDSFHIQAEYKTPNNRDLLQFFDEFFLYNVKPVTAATKRPRSRKVEKGTDEGAEPPTKFQRVATPELRDPLTDVIPKLLETSRSTKSRGIRFGSDYFPCGCCQKVYKTFEELKEHLVRAHNRTHPCKHCSRAYEKYSSLYQHTHTHHYKTKFYCEPCRRYFTRPNELRIHNEKQHSNVEESDTKGEDLAEMEPISFEEVADGEEMEGDEMVALGNTFQVVIKQEFVEDSPQAGVSGFYPIKKEEKMEVALDDAYLEEERLDSDLEEAIEESEQDEPKSELLIDRPITQIKNNRPIRRMFYKPEFFPCGYCDNDYDDFAQLEQHLGHIHSRPFACKTCSSSFPTYSSLRVHINYLHMSGRGKECPHCGLLLTDERHFRVHVQRHVTEKPFECHTCGRRFLSSSQLSAHRKKKKKCGPVVEAPDDDAATAAADDSSSYYQCDVCGFKIRYYTNLRRHMMAHFPIKRYECPADDCGASFESRNAFHQHKEQAHRIKERKCRYCFKVFDCLEFEFREHLRTQHDIKFRRKSTRKYILFGEDYYPCGYCIDGTSFTTFEELQEHHAVQHDRGFTCSECSRAYDNEKQRELHYQEVHVEQKGYKCNICLTLMFDKRHFDIHVERHTNKDKPYVCKYCNSRFAASSGLTKHQRQVCKTAPKDEGASGKPVYECEICGYKIRYKGNIARHMVFHQTNRTCEHCGKIFDNTRVYEEHLRRHTGEKPIICEKCGKDFATVMGLRAHHKRIENCHEKINDRRGRHPHLTIIPKEERV